MQKFYESYTFILSFLIGEVFIDIFLGDKATEYFLMLVLFSMVLINTHKITGLLNTYFLKED